jgi:hypothetical protein
MTRGVTGTSAGGQCLGPTTRSAMTAPSFRLPLHPRPPAPPPPPPPPPGGGAPPPPPGGGGAPPPPPVPPRPDRGLRRPAPAERS